MYRYLLLIVWIIVIGTPMAARAAITISEVAWMGGTASANHEWIELHNPTDASVAVEGWTLVDGANLLITLTGSIPAGAYAVLERTSDESAPGPAFLVYTGALVNTGATLTLRADDGQIIDQVVGGSDWCRIGGDNSTKATAQVVLAQWRTGVPTPGAPNAGTTAATCGDNDSPNTASPVVSTTTTTQKTGEVTPARRLDGGSSGETIPLRQATTELRLMIEAPTVVYERQTVPMVVTPHGVGTTIMNSLQYQWNFGDFTTATGSKVTHRFIHPGTYLVTINARFGRHDELARHTITVLPVTLSVTRTADAVYLHNDAVYDIDISGFRLVMGEEKLVLPPYSYLAAKQSVRLPFMNQAPLVLRDSRGAVVLREESAAPVAVVPESSPLVSLTAFETTGSINTPAHLEQVEPVPGVEAESLTAAPTMATDGSTTALEGATTTATPVNPSTSRWPLALLGLLLAGALGAVLWPRPVSSPSV